MCGDRVQLAIAAQCAINADTAGQEAIPIGLNILSIMILIIYKVRIRQGMEMD
jgi:hypothetical protein